MQNEFKPRPLYTSVAVFLFHPRAGRRRRAERGARAGREL